MYYSTRSVESCSIYWIVPCSQLTVIIPSLLHQSSCWTVKVREVTTSCVRQIYNTIICGRGRSRAMRRREISETSHRGQTQFLRNLFDAYWSLLRALDYTNNFFLSWTAQLASCEKSHEKILTFLGCIAVFVAAAPRTTRRNSSTSKFAYYRSLAEHPARARSNLAGRAELLALKNRGTNERTNERSFSLSLSFLLTPGRPRVYLDRQAKFSHYLWSSASPLPPHSLVFKSVFRCQQSFEGILNFSFPKTCSAD